jgi:arginyl-tRNA synthetase
MKPAEMIDPQETGLWAADKILKEYIQPVCARAGIRFDQFFSEKNLHTEGKVSAMLEFLREKGLVFEKEGAQWYRSTQFGDDKDRVLVKTDGRCTYRLADFAYHKDKFDRGFDRLITILGADHHSEAQEMRVFIEEILGKDANSYRTILTQFVRIIQDGKEVKMSKRKGTYFALDDLIEEVGVDAMRFIFISYSATSHISFDMDLAVERSEKNPVYFVQYAHARMASIIKKAKEKNIFPEMTDFSVLVHPKEKALLRKMSVFSDLIQEVSETYEVHRIPQYARELADLFHSFYVGCHITGESDKKIASARLTLVMAVKTVLAETLRLCGVSAPEKM